MAAHRHTSNKNRKPTASRKRKHNQKRHGRRWLVLALLGASAAAYYLFGWQNARPRGSAQLPSPVQVPQAAAEMLQAPDRHLLPAVCPSCQLVQRYAFSLSYNETHEQPEWVAYVMNTDRLRNVVQRQGVRFAPDPAITTGSASLKDYRGSGYDRGHLVPAGDMNFSAQAMRESFYLSNISPQLRRFNAGVWQDLESAVRRWTDLHGLLFVVAGPVLKHGLPTIGTNRISVPEEFYKLVVDVRGPEYEAIAFWMPHQAQAGGALETFAITVDELEQKLGTDLLAPLPDAAEAELESRLNLDFWFQ